MRTCRKCGEAKPVGEFKNKSTCKRCDYLAAVAWRKANPERYRAQIAKTRRNAPDMHRADSARRRAGSDSRIHPLVALELADGVCGICGQDVDPLRFELDHIVPLYRGGPHETGNVQVAHPLCNQRKGRKVMVDG